MPIESALLTFASTYILWRIINIGEVLDKGYKTGKLAYKGGNFLTKSVKKQYQHWQDYKNPLQALEREEASLFDTLSSEEDIQEATEKANIYLVPDRKPILLVYL